MTAHGFVSHPVNHLHGDIEVPGDKSISHRAIIFASIAKGSTTLNGLLEGEDCLATLKAFQSMGVTIEGSISRKVLINGKGKYGLHKPKYQIDCGNSGTTMRLLSGLLAAQSFDSQLTGDVSLLRRPMERIASPLMQMGGQIETQQGRAPLKISGGQPLRGIIYPMPVASAQVKSCLLLAGLYAAGETKVIEPVATRDHTERLLKAFSYPLEKQGNALIIRSTGECQATEITIPGDISSASFFIVAATLIPGAELWMRNVGVNPTRIGILHLLRQMGANITITNRRVFGEEPVADLHIQYAPLKGIEIPKEMVPLAIDEFPILLIAAACAKGITILRGARELRCKESDRIASMVEGLQQLGINAQAMDDGAIVEGGIIQGGMVDSQHDHRVAMAFAVAGAVAKAPVYVLHVNQVATSFPQFVNTANKVNLVIQEQHGETK